MRVVCAVAGSPAGAIGPRVDLLVWLSEANALAFASLIDHGQSTGGKRIDSTGRKARLAWATEASIKEEPLGLSAHFQAPRLYRVQVTACRGEPWTPRTPIGSSEPHGSQEPGRARR